ncbi:MULTISPECIES: hypothetical protein [Pseudomonas]|nr:MULTISPECIES: hypothetical protein [Pseudomonas]
MLQGDERCAIGVPLPWVECCQIFLKLGMVMKSDKLKKYMPVSPNSFLSGLIAGCFFVHFKFDGFVEENASFVLIKWGAVIGAITMCIALILSFLSKDILKKAIVKKSTEIS